MAPSFTFVSSQSHHSHFDFQDNAVKVNMMRNLDIQASYHPPNNSRNMRYNMSKRKAENGMTCSSVFHSSTSFQKEQNNASLKKRQYFHSTRFAVGVNEKRRSTLKPMPFSTLLPQFSTSFLPSFLSNTTLLISRCPCKERISCFSLLVSASSRDMNHESYHCLTLKHQPSPQVVSVIL